MKDYKISLLADLYGALLSDKALQLIRLYYDNDLSLAEIAEETGDSRQAISFLVRKTADKLNDYETKLHLRDRNDKLKAMLEEVERLLQDGKTFDARKRIAECYELI